MSKFGEWQRELANESRLRETIERLRQDGRLSQVDADNLLATLPTTLQESQYVLKHLGAHFALGLIFAFDIIPLPLGMISRGLWVVGNGTYEWGRGRRDLATVHSLPVLGVSLIPFVGYFAYLIPLQTRSADAAFLYANHITYLRKGCSLDAWLGSKPSWLSRIIRSIVGPSRESVGTPAP